MIILAAALLAAAPADCDGDTTTRVEACLADGFAAADAELNRYYRAAVRRLTSEKQTDALAQLRRAETAWIAYRDAECGAVRTWWSPGSISDAEAATCRIRITQARTATIWRDWLTYADSTPPILPPPANPD
jgi:uncharacterized protein YecT (DUF1311 family)